MRIGGREYNEFYLLTDILNEILSDYKIYFIVNNLPTCCVHKFN